MNRATRTLLAAIGLTFLSLNLAAVDEVSASGPRRAVLGIPRLSEGDLLLMRDGTRRTGIVSQATFLCYTAHGELAWPRKLLAGLDLTENRNGFCSVVTEAGDRITGFLAAPTFELQTATNGRAEQIGRGEVVKLLFQLQTSESASRPRDCLVYLRNGDFFTARWLEGSGRFTAIESGAGIDWSADAVDAVTFPDAASNQARVLLGAGKVVVAEPAARSFRFELAGGLPLEIAPARVDQLTRFDGSVLPADLLARIGAPVTGVAGSEPLSVLPPSGVVPAAGMSWIPPGGFAMGSPSDELDRDLDEGPPTQMVIPAGFWMGRHEVTQAEYVALMGQNPSQYQYEGEALHPVEKVSWHDAMDYCRRLTERERQAGNIAEDHVYRLPTEAEWEYACRAGTTSRFSFGDDPGYAAVRDHVWYSRNSDSTTHPVGTKRPNARGLHDMHGNVLEWCLDAWRGTLPGGAQTNLVVLPEGTLRAVRGGSWLYDARYARSANRDSYGALVRCSDLGFRVVLAPVAGSPAGDAPGAIQR